MRYFPTLYIYSIYIYSVHLQALFCLLVLLISQLRDYMNNKLYIMINIGIQTNIKLFTL